MVNTKYSSLLGLRVRFPAVAQYSDVRRCSFALIGVHFGPELVETSSFEVGAYWNLASLLVCLLPPHRAVALARSNRILLTERLRVSASDLVEDRGQYDGKKQKHTQ